MECPTVSRFAIALCVAIPFAGLVLSHLAGWHDEFGIPKPAVLVLLWALLAWILVFLVHWLFFTAQSAGGSLRPPITVCRRRRGEPEFRPPATPSRRRWRQP